MRQLPLIVGWVWQAAAATCPAVPLIAWRPCGAVRERRRELIEGGWVHLGLGAGLCN